MMNQDSSGIPSPRAEPSPVSGEGQLPGNWKDAIPNLIASRIGIFRIEAQDAIEVVTKKLILLGVTVFCLIATWGLLTAGLIGMISAHFDCPWYLSAFSVGGVYLLISMVMLLIIKKAKKTESFSITREEFEKDRKWLNQLNNRSNSQS
jgi:uncharacterized membrane protein YqjE